MYFSQIQFQTTLNIDLFITNYLARSLRIFGNWSGQTFKKIEIVIKSQSINQF